MSAGAGFGGALRLPMRRADVSRDSRRDDSRTDEIRRAVGFRKVLYILVNQHKYIYVTVNSGHLL